MAKVFLDANYFIDLVEERRSININSFSEQSLYISAISIHILTHLYKYKVPSQKLNVAIGNFSVVPTHKKLVKKALMGPTSDFEDNVQLHSASKARVDYFLTSDKKLLKMKFFGDVEIVTSL